MNKAIKGLLVAMLAVSATVQASTNKTFLLPRSHGVNLPMELSTFNQLIHRKAADKFGANFQAVGFFNRTADEDETGKYFGIKNKSTFTLQKGAVGGAASITDADLGYFVHEFNNVTIADGTNTTVKLHPKQEAWGVRFDYFQDLEKIVKGLYLKVTVPVVHVENNVELKVTSAHATAGTNLQNFLQGKATGVAGAQNVQAALDHMKMDGKNDSTGVADIDIVLGYNFLHKDCHHVGINIGFTIPTGDEADSVHAFEAIVGNGNHWAFGVGLDAMFRAWGCEDHNVKVTAALNYRYLFKESEKRSLGLKDAPGFAAGSVDWGHYVLLGQVGKAKANGLIPAANVATFNVDVTPGSQLDGVIALAYNNGGLCIDFGYNLFWKDDEEVKLKAADITAIDTAASAYGIAQRNFDATAGGNFVAADFVGGAVLTSKNIDTKAAETGSQVTHKIFAAVGYIFSDWECPLMLGAGGGYEFRGSNDALEKWELWLKIGIGF